MNPTIKALRDELAKERDDLRSLFVEFDGDRKGEFIEKYLMIWNDVYDIMEESRYHRAMINSMVAGHEAASARLLGLLEKALLVIEFNANLVTWVDSKNQNISHTYAFGVEKAREFLTTLADASGEMNKDGE